MLLVAGTQKEVEEPSQQSLLDTSTSYRTSSYEAQQPYLVIPCCYDYLDGEISYPFVFLLSFVSVSIMGLPKEKKKKRKILILLQRSYLKLVRSISYLEIFLRACLRQSTTGKDVMKSFICVWANLLLSDMNMDDKHSFFSHPSSSAVVIIIE